MLISTEISLGEYLDKKLSDHSLPLNLRHYLIELLCSYIHSENFFEKPKGNSQQYQEKSLSDLFDKTQKAQSQKEKNFLLKSMGDFSLCLSGFFRESIKKKLVDLSYYQEMGQTAYYCISQSYKPKSNIFEELSREFRSLSKILFSIHKDSLAQSQNKYLLFPTTPPKKSQN